MCENPNPFLITFGKSDIFQFLWGKKENAYAGEQMMKDTTGVQSSSHQIEKAWHGWHSPAISTTLVLYGLTAIYLLFS